jgi:glycosyltransferase involved in cell wall biosynthesis
VAQATDPGCTWYVDWSDGEHADFEAAASDLGLAVPTVRSVHTGTSVGTRVHRLRSYPAYGRLSAGALRDAERPAVFWQPLASYGALAAPANKRPPVVVLAPILSTTNSSPKQRMMIKALQRADRVIFLSSIQADEAIALGVPAKAIRVLPLGVRAKATEPAGPGKFLLAGGREHRDWPLVAKAAAGVPMPVRVGAPNLPADTGALEVVPPLSRDEYTETLMDASALIVALIDSSRPAGLLAILQALSFGIPVIATSGALTDDYLSDDAGILVPAGDVGAMHEAMVSLCDPAEVQRRGAAALAAAQGRLSLATFIENVHAVVDELR